MSGATLQFIGSFNPDWLSADECRAAKSDVQLYRFGAPLSVVVPGVGVITIPRGFVTDMASVPWFAQSYVGTEHPALNFPAAIHDFLYSVCGRFHPDLPALTREQVDQLFHDLLIVCGMRKSQAWVLHRSVRIGGGSHWKLAA